MSATDYEFEAWLEGKPNCDELSEAYGFGERWGRSRQLYHLRIDVAEVFEDIMSAERQALAEVMDIPSASSTCLVISPDTFRLLAQIQRQISEVLDEFGD